MQVIVQAPSDNALTPHGAGVVRACSEGGGEGCGLLAPADKDWAISLWGKNISDELYRTNIIPFFGEEVSRYGPPRTQGVEFRLNFE